MHGTASALRGASSPWYGAGGPWNPGNSGWADLLVETSSALCPVCPHLSAGGLCSRKGARGRGAQAPREQSAFSSPALGGAHPPPRFADGQMWPGGGTEGGRKQHTQSPQSCRHLQSLTRASPGLSRFHTEAFRGGCGYISERGQRVPAPGPASNPTLLGLMQGGPHPG